MLVKEKKSTWIKETEVFAMSEGMAEDAKVDDGASSRLRRALKQLRKDREEERAARELLEEMQQNVDEAQEMCAKERALSVSSDESEAPGEANTRVVWCIVGKLGVDVCCPAICDMFAVMVVPMPRVSIDKFTFVLVRVMSKRCIAVRKDEAVLAHDGIMYLFLR